MILFFFTDIFFLALGGILYITVRALPRIADEPADKKGILDRWAHSEIPEKVDVAVNTFLFKFLRKVKVSVLKLDNSLSGHLEKVNEKKNKTAIDFSDVIGEKEEKE